MEELRLMQKQLLIKKVTKPTRMENLRIYVRQMGSYFVLKEINISSAHILATKRQ